MNFYDIRLNNLTIYIAGAVIIVLVLLFIVIIITNRTKRAKPFDIEVIKAALNLDNVIKVEFVRNKMNITLKDVKKTNMKALQEAGAVGINIVGDKVKCYFKQDNERIYEALKDALEER